MKTLIKVQNQTNNNQLNNLVSFVHRLNDPLWKIHGIASINFASLQLSNQIQNKIMQCQGYYLKITLGTRWYTYIHI